MNAKQVKKIRAVVREITDYKEETTYNFIKVKSKRYKDAIKITLDKQCKKGVYREIKQKMKDQNFNFDFNLKYMHSQKVEA